MELTSPSEAGASTAEVMEQTSASEASRSPPHGQRHGRGRGSGSGRAASSSNAPKPESQAASACNAPKAKSAIQKARGLRRKKRVHCHGFGGTPPTLMATWRRLLFQRRLLASRQPERRLAHGVLILRKVPARRKRSPHPSPPTATACLTPAVCLTMRPG